MKRRLQNFPGADCHGQPSGKKSPVAPECSLLTSSDTGSSGAPIGMEPVTVFPLPPLEGVVANGGRPASVNITPQVTPIHRPEEKRLSVGCVDYSSSPIPPPRLDPHRMPPPPPPRSSSKTSPLVSPAVSAVVSNVPVSTANFTDIATPRPLSSTLPRAVRGTTLVAAETSSSILHPGGPVVSTVGGVLRNAEGLELYGPVLRQRAPMGRGSFSEDSTASTASKSSTTSSGKAGQLSSNSSSTDSIDSQEGQQPPLPLKKKSIENEKKSNTESDVEGPPTLPAKSKSTQPKIRQEHLEQRHLELLRRQKQLQEQYHRLQNLQRSGGRLAPVNVDLKKTGSESNLISRLGLSLPPNTHGSLSNLASSTTSASTGLLSSSLTCSKPNFSTLDNRKSKNSSIELARPMYSTLDSRKPRQSSSESDKSNLSSLDSKKASLSSGESGDVSSFDSGTTRRNSGGLVETDIL